MVRNMGYPVYYRVSHVDVGRGHIDAGTQYLSAVLVFAGLHILEQVFFHTPVSVRAFLSRLLESSSVFLDFVSVQIADESFSFFDELDCSLIHRIKIV